jgi:threonine synthase
LDKSNYGAGSPNEERTVSLDGRVEEFRCRRCGKIYDSHTYQWQCENCGGAFEIHGKRGFRKEAIVPDDFSLWRYSDSLPSTNPVSLGEGLTPMVHASMYGSRVHLKAEFLAPTGSFKDRGATTLVSFLRDVGITEVIEDSSGNSAASLAAYCAAAGMSAKIFVPSDASAAKLRQIRAYGAELVRVPGPRTESARAAMDTAKAGSYYASHCWHPLIFEGLKTFSFEVAEQLNWNVPDAVLFPVGNGILILGAYMGFRELYESGVTKAVPKLFAVQASACAPLAEAFRLGESDPVEVPLRKTIAEGVRIASPVRGSEILGVVRETGGMVLTVDEEEIIESLSELARLGLYVEPTSPVATAGLKKSLREGFLTANDTVVVPLTGTGLKASGEQRLGVLDTEETGRRQ